MRRRNSSFKNILTLMILSIIVAIGAFIYFSPIFEKKKPIITFINNGYWNAKDKLNIKLEDESGIKSYKISFKINDASVEVQNKVLESKQDKLSIDISPVKIDQNVKTIKLAVEAYDNSMWNLFRGNTVYKEFTLNIDRKRPLARVITNSYNIKRGGSAAVVVEVKDENLREKYITFNDKYKFELIPYLKEGFYAAIIAWPVEVEFEQFDIVNLVAIDEANNVTVRKVPLYIKDLKIKNDKLKISDNFINKVSIPVLQKSDMEIPSTNDEIFIKQNRFLRAKNVSTIRDESIKNMSKEMINNFSINPFKRLSGSKTFAGFAEKREYFYDGQKIDEAWHLGMDWASIKRAPVKVSNGGTVIFNSYLGIYGNTAIIDHKLGLQTLYAHTSKLNVQKGDLVRTNDNIANTGSTGAVFGDHLHFGVLVQGIEVNPIEWMDKNWIKTRVLDILSEAKKEIRSSK